MAVVMSGALIARWRYRPVLRLGTGAMVVGLGTIAFAPNWQLVLAGAFTTGLGFGLVNVSFNLGLAIALRPRAAPALNLVNAIFGVGAVVGPLLVAAFEPRLWPPFVTMMALALGVMLLVGKLEFPKISVGARSVRGLPWALLAGFVLLYFLYVATEGGVAAWETEYLAPLFGPATAAGFTSLFWGALTIGRFLSAPLSARIAPKYMVLGAAVLTLTFALLAHDAPRAPLYYALVGLSLAPVFATSLAWLTQVFPDRAERVTPIVVAAANLGPVLTAPLIGLSVAAWGPAVIPTALALLALLLLLSTAFLAWRT